MKSSPELALSAAVAASMARRQSAWAAPTIVVETDEFPSKAQQKRRKSWHSRLERRRRKGVVMAVGGTDPHAVAAAAAISSMNAGHHAQQPIAHPSGHIKQKRPSWWNIFVPDHWPRPRRASQDVSRSTSGEPIVPWLRSKSRSVDHGFSTPFDLDSLRSKVEGRFEAVQGEGANFNDGAEGGKETGAGGRVAPKNTQPLNTVPYTVEANDTLTSVAARFDTTPSEVAKLNRLPQRLPLFPGQVLYIPAERAAGRTGASATDPATNCESSQARRPSDPAADDTLAPGATTAAGATDLPFSDGAAEQERELLDSLRPASPLPPGGRVRTPSGGDLLSGDSGSGSCACPSSRGKGATVPERFLRINVRHITDGQGVVGGVLLVTPNAVMFDPNVSDPLVIEHGPESYGVIAPMEFVVNAAIYHDIAHMRVRHMPDTPRTDLPKPVIYHPDSPEHAAETESLAEPLKVEEGEAGATAAASESSPAKDECFPELAHHTSSSNSPENDETSLCSCEPAAPAAELTVIPREGGAFPKAFERDLVTPTAHLVEEKSGSIYDSGIDMRDNAASTSAAQTIAEEEPAAREEEEKTTSSGGPRKKASSVSFCELEKEIIPDPADKQESRKTKVFKRLSYPLTWMEGLGGEKESMNPSGATSASSSQPGSADSKESHHSSVFSKVFSSSPLSLVDLGSTLFIKEPPSSPLSLSQVGPSMGPSAGPSEPKPIFEFPPTSESFKHAGGRSSMDVARRHHQETTVHRASVAGPGPKLDYRSMVSVEDMPELFVSFDKLIPRPARPCDDPPLYLRLRMGKPILKRIPKSTPIMSYGKKKMRPEYWFSVPRNRVDDLYRFLQIWVPHLYGELEDMDLTERGYELVDSDTELWAEDEADAGGRSKTNSGSTSSAGEIAGELTRESWEVLSMSEELRRALYAAGGSAAGSFDLDVFGLPELVGTSEILTDPHRARLVRHLPARAEGYPWTLVFSTSLHGFSLNSMFRKMAKVESPILLVCQDTENNVFGALTSCALKVSDHFYGTGESFLFRFTPPATPAQPSTPNGTPEGGSPTKEESSPVTTPTPAPPAGIGALQVFDWTGDNIYFIKGNNESLAIGSGDGKFGLWLDGDLYQGRTQPCSTYGNVALVEGEDFVVKTLECWAFV